TSCALPPVWPRGGRRSTQRGAPSRVMVYVRFDRPTDRTWNPIESGSTPWRAAIHAPTPDPAMPRGPAVGAASCASGLGASAAYAAGGCGPVARAASVVRVGVCGSVAWVGVWVAGAFCAPVRSGDIVVGLLTQGRHACEPRDLSAAHAPAHAIARSMHPMSSVSPHSLIKRS